MITPDLRKTEKTGKAEKARKAEKSGKAEKAKKAEKAEKAKKQSKQKNKESGKIIKNKGNRTNREDKERSGQKSDKTFGIQKNTAAVYLLLLTASVLLASFRGGAVPYGLLELLLLIPAAAAGHLLYSVRFFEMYQQVEDHHTEKRKPVRYCLILENAGPLPISNIRFLREPFCRMDESVEREIFSLLPGERRELPYDIICIYAGTYPIGISRICFQDAFSLFYYRIKTPVPCRIICPPGIIEENNSDPSSLIQLNRYLSPDRKSDISMSPDLREYQKGDDIRKVHWKNTARSGKLMIRLPEELPDEPGEAALLNRESPVTIKDMEERDLFLERIASLAWQYLSENRAIVFYYQRAGIQRIVLENNRDFRKFIYTLPDLIDVCDTDRKEWKKFLDLKSKEIQIIEEISINNDGFR